MFRIDSRSAERERVDRDEKLDPEREAQRAAEKEAEREAAKRQKEIDDLTKDQRTIFVSQLTMKVGESDLRNFFGQVRALDYCNYH